jgi:hypothetical protein
VEIIAGLTGPCAVVAARTPTVGMDEVSDCEAAVLALHDRDWEFSLRTISSLHDLADSETAVLYRHVRMMAVSRGFHGCKSWRWVMVV